MALGSGKYNAMATHARRTLHAQGVFLLVLRGKKGDGGSAQWPAELYPQLIEMLENITRETRRDYERWKKSRKN